MNLLHFNFYFVLESQQVLTISSIVSVKGLGKFPLDFELTLYYY